LPTDNKNKQQQQQPASSIEGTLIEAQSSPTTTTEITPAAENVPEITVLDERRMEVYDEKRYPGLNRGEFQRYYETLAADSQKLVNRLATKKSWTVSIDVNDSANNDEAVPNYKQFSFNYTPVSVKVWRNIEFQQSTITDLEREEAIILQNAQVEAKKSEEEEKTFIDAKELKALRWTIAEKRANLYFYVAQKYLGMTKVQYENTIYDDIHFILDACMFRTQHPVEISQNLRNSSGTG
jgi:hypothetical protein